MYFGDTVLRFGLYVHPVYFKCVCCILYFCYISIVSINYIVGLEQDVQCIIFYSADLKENPKYIVLRTIVQSGEPMD